MQKVLLPSVQSKINQIHNRIITLEVKVKFKTDCEKSMQHYLHMWKMYDEANVGIKYTYKSLTAYLCYICVENEHTKIDT
jgi:hypothetical protein